MEKAMNTFREGRVHVMARMCDSCIFRPGNLMNLDEGRLEQMIGEATERNTAIICHSTLFSENAACRGFFDKHPTPVLRIAAAMNAITFDSAEGRHP